MPVVAYFGFVLSAIHQPVLTCSGTVHGSSLSQYTLPSVLRPAGLLSLNLRGRSFTVPANGCLATLLLRWLREGSRTVLNRIPQVAWGKPFHFEGVSRRGSSSREGKFLEVGEIGEGDKGLDRETRGPTDVTLGAPSHKSGRLAGSWNKSSRHQAIQTEFSWTGTDQPHKKQYVKNFGKIKEIVHPIKRGSFNVARKLSGQDGDQHIHQQHKTSEA